MFIATVLRSHKTIRSTCLFIITTGPNIPNASRPSMSQTQLHCSALPHIPKSPGQKYLRTTITLAFVLKDAH